MTYIFLCLAVFLVSYLINIVYITVFYHRGLTHSAIKMSPALQWFVVKTGNWFTGLDPKGWTCMHRMHHRFSDTEKDPHSPHRYGIFGLMKAQLNSYEKVLRGLAANRPKYTSMVQDLNFDVHWLNKRGLWFLPYVVHALIALTIGLVFGYWLLGVAYWLGMMSHPIQGWMVNSFGHYYGYRNFNTTDKSTNNTIVAWLVAGEGFQNNHHRSPRSAKFSYRWFEFDMGYAFCLAFEAVGAIRIIQRSIDVHEEEQEDYLPKNISLLQG